MKTKTTTKVKRESYELFQAHKKPWKKEECESENEEKSLDGAPPQGQWG